MKCGEMYLPFVNPNKEGLEDLNVSFEFFPPKTEKMEQTLWRSIDVLAPLAPKFVSVTYGAGGSTREKTHEIVTGVQDKTGVPAAAHLTCVDAKKEEINDIAQQYWQAGIRHIVALRGDPVGGMGKTYQPTEGGYDYASDLVLGLKEIADFEISVAGYPETHPEAVSPQADMDNLKRKIDNGADRIISQFFMTPDTFLKYRDRVADAGIDVPVVPGILPISNFNRTVEFATVCGAEIPPWMPVLFNGLDDHAKTRELVAATIAAEQCRILYENGVRDFHFYTLNRAELTHAICHMLGMRPKNSDMADKADKSESSDLAITA